MKVVKILFLRKGLMNFLRALSLIVLFELTGCLHAGEERIIDDNQSQEMVAEHKNFFDQELEMDDILDQMDRDGTIVVKPVTPAKIWLRSIGSAIFVKYVALRMLLQSWWKYIWSGNTSEHIS